MIFSSKKDERSQVYEELTTQITAIVHNTNYQLKLLQVHPESFGNAVVEVENNEMTVRFVQDRGDIYRDKKSKDTERWIDEQLVFSHNEPSNGIYESLLKAIDSFVKQ